VEDDKFGEIVSTDLRPGGKECPVTEDNKKEYVECVRGWPFESRAKAGAGSSRSGASRSGSKTSSRRS
jgi:E3 ubiquitin-protein ligase NEDD4